MPYIAVDKGRDDGVTTPEELLDAIKGAATRPRLIVLSACESAAATGAAAFVSLGPALAAAGVDAVLAMSAAVSMDTARAFCSHFYERLFAHGVIDRAVNEARASVRDALDWGVPVLFSRMRDCQLLEFAASRVDAAYLSVSDRTVRAALRARGQGEREQVAGDVLAATTALVEELERSHKLLTGVCADFRRTGDDPATFKQQFEGFRNNFKEYFDKTSSNSRPTSVSSATPTVRSSSISRHFSAPWTRKSMRLPNCSGPIFPPRSSAN